MWIFREARDIYNDIDVSSWGHGYRTRDNMADRLLNIAMNIGATFMCTLPQTMVLSRRLPHSLTMMITTDWGPLSVNTTIYRASR